MKKVILFVLFLNLASCTVNKSPEFKEIKNVKLLHYSISTITVSSELLFYNPNGVGGNLELTDLKIYSNDVLISESKSLVFKAPAKKEFAIPLTTEIRTNNIIKKPSDLMALAMNATLDKKIPLHYKGTIVYKLAGMHYDYPIDYKTEISLKK